MEDRAAFYAKLNANLSKFKKRRELYDSMVKRIWNTTLPDNQQERERVRDLYFELILRCIAAAEAELTKNNKVFMVATADTIAGKLPEDEFSEVCLQVNVTGMVFRAALASLLGAMEENLEQENVEMSAASN